MIALNNPAIGLVSRRFIRRLVFSGELDESCAELIEDVLDKNRMFNPCGWVFSLAETLGAARDTALQCASFSEICSATIQYIDDIQDGDASTYINVPIHLQINVGIQLLTICCLYATKLEYRWRGHRNEEFVAHVMRLLIAMSTGQRIELMRENWTPAQYELMSRLLGSRQFEIYFRAATLPTQEKPDSFLPLAEPMGILVQMVWDFLYNDPRIMCFSSDEIHQIWTRSYAQLLSVLTRIPEQARTIMTQILFFMNDAKELDQAVNNVKEAIRREE